MPRLVDFIDVNRDLKRAQGKLKELQGDRSLAQELKAAEDRQLSLKIKVSGLSAHEGTGFLLVLALSKVAQAPFKAGEKKKHGDLLRKLQGEWRGLLTEQETIKKSLVTLENQLSQSKASLPGIEAQQKKALPELERSEQKIDRALGKLAESLDPGLVSEWGRAGASKTQRRAGLEKLEKRMFFGTDKVNDLSNLTELLKKGAVRRRLTNLKKNQSQPLARSALSTLGRALSALLRSKRDHLVAIARAISDLENLKRAPSKALKALEEGQKRALSRAAGLKSRLEAKETEIQKAIQEMEAAIRLPEKEKRELARRLEERKASTLIRPSYRVIIEVNTDYVREVAECALELRKGWQAFAACLAKKVAEESIRWTSSWISDAKLQSNLTTSVIGSIDGGKSPLARSFRRGNGGQIRMSCTFRSTESRQDQEGELPGRVYVTRDRLVIELHTAQGSSRASRTFRTEIDVIRGTGSTTTYRFDPKNASYKRRQKSPDYRRHFETYPPQRP